MTSEEMVAVAFDLENMGEATGNIAMEESGERKKLWEEAEKALDEAAVGLRKAAKLQKQLEDLN